MKTSVLTVYSGRHKHLLAQYSALIRGSELPDEWIIVAMGEHPIAFDDPPFPIHTLELSVTSAGRPMATARNRAVARSSGDIMIFLEIGSLPQRDFVREFKHEIRANVISVASITHLPPGACDTSWLSQPFAWRSPSDSQSDHQNQQQPNQSDSFSAICFGLVKETYEKVGGFDERYLGYGGEELDFALRAVKSGTTINHSAVGVLHHQEEAFRVPLRHLKSIVRNSKLFRQTWGHWPREDWLDHFEQMGFIAIDRAKNSIRIVRYPTKEEIANEQL